MRIGAQRPRLIRAERAWPIGRRSFTEWRESAGERCLRALGIVRPGGAYIWKGSERSMPSPPVKNDLYGARPTSRVLSYTARRAPGNSDLRNFRNPSRSRRRLRTRRHLDCYRGCRRDSRRLKRMSGRRWSSGGTPRPHRMGILASTERRPRGSARLVSRGRSTRACSPALHRDRGSRPLPCTRRVREQAQG